MDQTREIPEEIAVNLAGQIIPMSFESVVASMANQLVSRSAIPPGLTYYGMFDLFKNDIERYLQFLFESNPDTIISLFDDTWPETFFEWKTESNKPYCKDLIVTFPDGSEWSIRALDIASIRAEKLLNSDSATAQEFLQERDFLLDNEENLLKWVEENLTWEEVCQHAEEIKRPQPEMDYEAAWKSAPKIMKAWEEDMFVLGWPFDPSEDESDED